ncbi:hypothetical protein MJM69_23870 [Salmonella enterica subsp. enterica serovar Kentucky]|nr:hypothetical protein [Salmonella enterica subsp. enterica serovar Kentucky]
MHNLSREQKIELVKLLEEKKRREFVYRYRGYYETDTNGSVSSFLPKQNIGSAL